MTFCRRSLLAALLVLCGTVRVHAQTAEKRADDLFAKSQQMFKENRFQDATEALRAAYVYSPRPVFLYSMGQAYRLAHDCKQAVKYYRDFLKAFPSHAQEKAVQQNIDRCAQEDPDSIVEPPAPVVPTPANTNPTATSQTTTITEAPPPKHVPVYKKWWLWTTVSVVVVGVGLGVGLGLGLPHGTTFKTTIPPVGPGAM